MNNFLAQLTENFVGIKDTVSRCVYEEEILIALLF